MRPTQICPLKCDHCSANSGPDTGQTASVDELRCWVKSVCKTKKVEWIAIEGGEPFAVPKQLHTLLQVVNECCISSAVLTSGFWAQSLRRAERVLANLPSISLLMLSVDEFHQRQIPIQFIGNAIEAGLKYANKVIIQICIQPDDESFLSYIKKELGVRLYSQIGIITVPLQPSGRALTTGVMPEPEITTQILDYPCLFLGTPVVREDGVFVACCQQDVVLRDNPSLFHFGNLNEQSAEELMNRIDADPYIQTLRVFGPHRIAELAIEHNWGWKPKSYRKNNICDVCRDLSSHHGVVKGFYKLSASKHYKRLLAASRLILYGESSPSKTFTQMKQLWN